MKRAGIKGLVVAIAATVPFAFGGVAHAQSLSCAEVYPPTCPTLSIPSTTFPAGDTVDITSDGWEPNSIVNIFLLSTPIKLGSAKASAAGVVSGTFKLPAGVTAGTHTLAVTGTGADGSPRTLAAVVTITESAGATGSNVGLPIGVAIGLVLLGGAVTMIARRKKVDAAA